MQSLPHHYHVNAVGKSDNTLDVKIENVEALAVAAPAQFGGPGDKWSPEDFFMASISSCLILSFKAIARASKFEWMSIQCNSTGTLDRIEGKSQFTEVVSEVKLVIAQGESIEKAERLLHKADSSCLVANSVKCKLSLNILEISFKE
ncbi:OsmC family protein [Glaciecola sp. XM2]|jgi:peroxiredoxin-like protein|uniref:OsmC family protein n=1 Tax=Glaciecola sp. XM2 TaxID=1914931 RepID=UPI001BDF37CD|nr:OsmC family protein [Glaciecola sp. XM2]MBT1450072.1 OsmC family protein [Glaciecola sp. XM2]